MTVHTTTSDVSSLTRQPVIPDSICTTLVPYNTQRLLLSLPSYFTSIPQEIMTAVCSGEVTVHFCLQLSLLLSHQAVVLCSFC